jgi:hypothetical protein
MDQRNRLAITSNYDEQQQQQADQAWNRGVQLYEAQLRTKEGVNRLGIVYFSGTGDPTEKYPFKYLFEKPESFPEFVRPDSIWPKRLDFKKDLYSAFGIPKKHHGGDVEPVSQKSDLHTGKRLWKEFKSQVRKGIKRITDWTLWPSNENK